MLQHEASVGCKRISALPWSSSFSSSSVLWPWWMLLSLFPSPLSGHYFLHFATILGEVLGCALWWVHPGGCVQHRATPGLFSQRLPCSPPHYEHFARDTLYSSLQSEWQIIKGPLFTRSAAEFLMCRIPNSSSSSAPWWKGWPLLFRGQKPFLQISGNVQTCATGNSSPVLFLALHMAFRLQDTSTQELLT